MYLEDKAVEDYRDMEKIQRYSWGSPTDWKAFNEKMVKCGASTVPYRDVVTESQHCEMLNGESVSNYYAALVKIVDKFYNPVQLKLL